MADTSFSDKLRTIGRETVVPPTARRQSVFDGPADFSTQNINSDLGPNQQKERDKLLLSPNAYAARYGQQALEERAFPTLGEFADPIRRSEARRAARSGGEVSGDSLRAFGSGLTRGVGGLVNLGARGVDAMARARSKNGENILWDNAEFLANSAEFTDTLASGIKDGQSSFADTKDAIAQLDKAPALADSELKYRDDLKKSADKYQRETNTTDIGSLTSSKLAQFGRDTMAKGQRILRDGAIQKDNFVENPEVAFATTAEATGSLIPSLVGSGGTTALARAALGKTGVSAAAKESAERLVTAGAVGALEGQGAYDSTVVEVGNMSEEELTANSKRYRELRANGSSHKDAQIIVGDEAGKRAQIIQTGIAAAAGYGVAKFEGNPLAGGGLKDTLKTIGSQTIEEGFQSGTGQISQNIGTRIADNDRDISDGVGESIVEGALGGFGATGVIKSPTLAKDVAVEAGRGVGTAVELATRANLQRLETKIDKTNPTGRAATGERIRRFEEIVRTHVSDFEETNASKATEQFVNTEDLSFESNALQTDIVEGSRLQTVRRVAEKLKKDKYSEEARVEAEQFLAQEISAIQEFVEQNRTEEDKATSSADGFARALGTILQNDTFAELISEPTPPAAPDGPAPELATLKDVIVDPVGVDPERVTGTLKSEFDGSPAENAAFRVAQALSFPKKTESTNTEKGKKDRAAVRNELLFSDGSKQYGSLQSFKELVSTAVKGAIKQERTGDTQVVNYRGEPVDAQDAVVRLGNLAQHQINKFNAATASLEASDANPGVETQQTYESLDPKTGTRFRPTGEIYINPRSEESLETYRQVREDANFGITAYNKILEEFGDVYPGTALELLPEIDDGLISRAQRPAESTETETSPQEPVVGETAREVETVQDTPVSEETVLRETSTDSGSGSSTTDTPTADQSGPELNQKLTEDSTPTTEQKTEQAEKEVDVEPTAGTLVSPLVKRNVDGAVGDNLIKNTQGKPILKETFDLNPVADLSTDVIQLARDSETLDIEITDGIAAELGALLNELDGMAEGMNQQLQKGLQRTNNGKSDGITFQKILTSNDPEIRNTKTGRAGRVLPLIDEQSLRDGEPKYDDTLLGLALLATVDFVLNTPPSGGVTKATDVADALGISKDTYVTADMWDVVNFGRSATDTKEALGRHIKEFWGAKANNDISESQTKGIPEAMADEILDYLSSQENADFWFQKKSLQVKGANNAVRTYTSFRTGNKGSDLGGAKTVIRDVLTPKDSTIHQYRLGSKFEPWTVPDTLKKDGDTAIPEKKRQAIRNQQDTEFKVSTDFADMMEFFGEDTFAEILGFVDLNADVENTPYNVNHLKSIEGKNASIKSSIQGVSSQLEQIKAYAESSDTQVGDVPIHYRMEISRNGRFFMQGFNPQSNKLAREMFSANRTTLDLKDPKQRQILMVAVAQSFDLKIENLGLEGSAKAAENLIAGDYRAAIDAVKSRDGDHAVAKKALKDALSGEGLERSAKVLKAILTVAKYEEALAKGETSLDVDLSLELDGKTNGPISSTIQNNLGEFSSSFLALVRRGGFFIGGSGVSPQNYAEFQQTDNSADLYEVVGDMKSSKLGALNLVIKKGDRTETKASQKAALSAQTQILQLLTEVGDVSFKPSKTEVNDKGEVTRVPGELRVKRSGTKGPITEQLYGAGENSIAAGLTNAIFQTTYEEITAAIQSQNGERLIRMAQILDSLASVETTKDYKTGKISVNETPISSSLVDTLGSKKALEEFTFGADAFNNITSSIAQLYVPAFSEALSETVGSTVSDVNTTLVEATNNHTDMYLQIVSKALQAETKKQRDSGKIGKGDELSLNDNKRILAKYRKYAPIIDVGSTIFNLSSGDQETTTDVDNRRRTQKDKEPTFNPRSETLSGKTSASKRDTLSGAGVRILPYNVIANADVAMITDVNTDPNMDLQSLSVHDGIETTLTSVDRVSQVMNKAVFNSWQKNTIEPVLQSLQSVSELSDVMKQLGVDQEYLDTLASDIERLQELSNLRDAKIHALSTVQMSVDGVPGAENPFVKSDGLAFSNEQELLDHLNGEAKIFLAQRQKEARKEKELKAEDSIELEDSKGSELRKALDDTGDARVFIEALGKAITNPDQKRVFDEIKASPALQDILDGGLKIVISAPAATGGSYDMINNTIFISNVTAETALHELVHAATAYQIQEHYQTPEATSERGKAVRRMESLMYDFAGRTYKEGSLEALVQSEIQLGLNKGDTNGKIEALNEFMAWSLSNEKLINKNKKKVANDPLSQVRALGSKTLKLMRRILGFSSNKVFDHILFNTTIILNSEQTLSKNNNADLENIIFRQKMAEGNTENVFESESQRRLELSRLLDQHVTAYLEKDTLIYDNGTPRQRSTVDLQNQYDASKSAYRASQAGFHFEDVQDLTLFKKMHAILSYDMTTDKVARLEAQRIYEAVVDKITPETFLKQMGTDYVGATEAETIKADNMYAVITGKVFEDPDNLNTFLKPTVNTDGISDRLSTFLALSQTNAQFREVLADIDFDSLGFKSDFDSGSVDGMIESLTRFSLGNVTARVLNSDNVNTQEALDVLSHILAQYDAEAASAYEQKASNIFRRMNDTTKRVIEGTASKVADITKEGAERIAGDGSTRNIARLLAGASLHHISHLSNFLVEDRATAQADLVTEALNSRIVPNTMRELWSEIRGRTEDTAGVYDLVKRAKQHVSSVREEYREKLPKILANQFSDKFNNADGSEKRKDARARQGRDWRMMHRGFGRTDVTTLLDSFGEIRAFSLFGTNTFAKNARRKAIKDAQNRVEKATQSLGLPADVSKRVADAYMTKAAQLGNYLALDVAGDNLLRSATAIAGLYNEDGSLLSKADYDALQSAIDAQRRDPNNSGFTWSSQYRNLIESIDVLASAEAVNGLDAATHGRLQKLIKEEKQGVRYVLAYTRDLRKREASKTDSTMAQINGHKGYLGTTNRPKSSLIIAPNSDHNDLVKAGYVRVRDYKSQESDVNKSTIAQGYYFSSSAGLANFNQGALQTVSQSYNGVDPVTGFTQGGKTSGAITGDYMKNLNRKLKAKGPSSSNDALLPVFNEFGDLIAFERAVGRDVQDLLAPEDNFAQELANWSGRIIEEQAALGLNESLIDALHEQYSNREFGTDDQYVEFSDISDELKNDKIWQDNYRLIPREVREYAAKKFDGPLMIRRDMINNALGFRSASVNDIFTGQTRMYEPIRKSAEAIALTILGKNARKYLSGVEDITQSVISEVKHTIVVKSAVILVANTVSNVVQLAGREVPVSYMVKRTKTKYAEVAQYKRNEELKIKLRADLLVADTPSRKENIQSKLTSIEESEKRMSIWPLIEAGEFTTISEGLTDADKAFMNGSLIDWVEGKAADLPGGLSTAARYAILSRDTALYQGMARGVQYSDFIAKAVYYDFLTEQRDSSKEDALAKVTEEFINYDLADGRTRSYLEGVGLTWFLNFKLRAIKIGLNLARNNPLTALFTIGGAGAIGLDVGSSITDNAISAFLDDRLGYSIGPGMVEAGWNLNLWNQIFGN